MFPSIHLLTNVWTQIESDDTSLEFVRSPGLIDTLLNYIEVLDIGEMDALGLSNQKEESGGLPHLRQLKTLIIREADDKSKPWLPASDLFVSDWHPQRLVIAGTPSSFSRILSYQRTKSSSDPTLSRTLWPSVHRLLHIIPHNLPNLYPSKFFRSTADCNIAASLPNLLQYDIFFDIDCAARDPSWQPIRTMWAPPDYHFARTIAWFIRNTPSSLPLIFWLSDSSEIVYGQRKALVKRLVLCPYDPETALWEEGYYERWSEEQLEDDLLCSGGQG